MLDLGINFNIEDGARKAEEELKKWQDRWQKLLSSTPLDIGIDAKGISREIEQTARTTTRSMKSIRDQIAYLQQEYNSLELGDNLAAEGRAILGMLHELQEKAGMFSKSMAVASRELKEFTSDAVADKMRTLEKQWKALTAEQRKGTEGSLLLNEWANLIETLEGYEGSLSRVYNAQKKLTEQQSKASTPKGLKEELKELADAWDKLTESERKSPVGEDILEKYRAIKESAGELALSIEGVIAAQDKLLGEEPLGRLDELRQKWNELTVEQRTMSDGRILVDEFNRAKKELDELNQTLDDAAQKQRAIEDAAKKTTKEFNQLKTYAANFVSVYGGIRFLKSVVAITGELEMQRVSLSAMLQDAHRGEKIFSQIKGLAVKSPFQIMDLISYAKQLSAFSVPYEELFDTTKRLADVSAGLGVDMGRIILAFGQVRSAAVLRGQELRQFTEAGIPLIELLAEKFTELNGEIVRTGDVFDMIYRRKVTFEMVRDIFTDMTSEGGKFYQMQEKQADTLKGMVKNLKDSYDIMVSELGEAHSGALKGSVETIRNLMKHHETIFNILVPTVVALGAYKAVLIAIGSIKSIKNLARDLNLATRVVMKGGEAMKDYQNIMNKAFSLKNVTSYLAILYVVGKTIFNLIQSANKLNKELGTLANTKFAEGIAKQRDLDILINKIRDTEEGTQKYRDAIDELNRKYKEFLPAQVKYSDSFDTITLAVERAKVSLMEYAKMQTMNLGEEKIMESYSKDFDKHSKKLKGSISTIISMTGEASMTTEEYMKKLTDFARENADVYAKSKKRFRDMAADLVDSMFPEMPDAYGMHFDVYRASLTAVESSLERIAKSVSDVTKKNQELQESVDLKYGTDTKTQELIKESEDVLKAQVDLLNESVLTQEEFSAEKERLQKEHLKRMIDIYENAGLGETKDAKTLKNELEQDLAEWQKIVNKTIGKERSFLTIEPTDYTALDYVKRVRDEYANLKSDLEIYSSMHDEDSKKIVIGLLEQKKATEAVADAMGFTLEEAKETAKQGLTQLEVFLKALEGRVREYRERVEIWSKAMEGVQHRFGLQKFKMDFDVTFDGKPSLIDYIKAEISNIANRQGLAVNLDLNFQTASLKDMIDVTKVDEDVLRVIESLFDELRNLYAQEYEELDSLLEGYLGYTQRKLDADQAYIEARRKMMELMKDDYSPEKMGYIREMLNEARIEYEDTLIALSDEVANRDEGFQDFVREIADKSAIQLTALLTMSEARLRLMELAGEGDTEDAAILEAKIRTLREELKNYKATADTKESTPEKAYKQWRQLHTVLGRVGKSIRDIGDDMKDGWKDAFDLGAEIVTGTMSIISSLETLTKMSIESTKNMAEGASKTMQAVERASVILAAVSAAFSIARKIHKFFTKTKELSEETKEKYKDLVDATNKVIESQARLLESMTGQDALSQHESIIGAINKQAKATRKLGKEYLETGSSLFKRSLGVRQQRELAKYSDELKRLGINYDSLGRNLAGLFDLSAESLKKLVGTEFWYNLDAGIRSYLETIIEAEGKTEDMAIQLTESLTGIDFTSIIDGLDEFIKMADRDFDMVAQNFEQYMLDALLHIVKSKYLTEALSEWHDDLADALKTESLSNSDMERLKIAYEEIARKAAEMFDAAKDIAGIDITGESNLKGIAKGIASASEDSVLLLAGYMDSLRFKLFPYIDRMENEFLNTVSQLSITQAEHINHLRAIEINTRITSETNTKMLDNISKVISPDGIRGAFAINVNA